MLATINYLKLHIMTDYFSVFEHEHTYTGHTEDYGAMVNHLEQKYPNSFIVAVGFSLGGNIVTKYMGDKEGKIPRNIIGGISICQGYNAVEYVQFSNE